LFSPILSAIIRRSCQFTPIHVDIGQRKHGFRVVVVILAHPFIAHFGKTKLLVDDPKEVFNFGANTLLSSFPATVAFDLHRYR
jgi:hypothetical protein